MEGEESATKVVAVVVPDSNLEVPNQGEAAPLDLDYCTYLTAGQDRLLDMLHNVLPQMRNIAAPRLSPALSDRSTHRDVDFIILMVTLVSRSITTKLPANLTRRSQPLSRIKWRRE